MTRKLKYIVPFALIMTVSCTKEFLDVNTDPNQPSIIEVSKLLPTAQKGLGDALAIGGGDNGGLSQVLSVYTHQVTTREEPDQYGATGNEFYLGTAWPKLYAATLSSPPLPEYGVLQNLEDIITNASAAGNLRFSGIARVLKAYAYSQLVDAFGDVPFSEANKLKDGILYPKFDDDAEIYPKLFTILDEAIADLNNLTAPNKLLPGSSDVIYQGDRLKWIKAANTIKLKLYVQQRKVKNVTAEVNQLISGGNLISSTAESFLLPYGPIGSTDDRNRLSMIITPPKEATTSVRGFMRS
jgi:hypothetical protein